MDLMLSKKIVENCFLRKELSDRLENAIAEMTGKNQKIERDVDDLRREELKAITSLTQRTEAIDEKVTQIINFCHSQKHFGVKI